MVSIVVWAVLAAVGILLGVIASWFSLSTVRWVSLCTALILAAAITTYGLSQPAGRNPTLVNAFTNGADALIKALLTPLLLGHAVPAPGPIGRGIAAFCLLMGYRGLEWWAMRRQPPQLDTSALPDGQPSIKPAKAGGALTDGQRYEQVAAELKFRLAAVEIRAPSILPGGSRTNGLASIAESSGLGIGGLAGAIIRFVGMLWPKPQRIQLRVWVESADESLAAPGAKVTVGLENLGSGATVSTKTIVGAEINEAASMVAGYVARQMFALDRTTPPWCYGAADGRDLGGLVMARMERVYVERFADVEKCRQAQIVRLRKATGSSRTAGVVAYELAQLLDLDTRHLDALLLHAVSREQHPRFYRGRYRLAMSLEMVANPKHAPFDAGGTQRTLDEILKILHRCGLTERDACRENDVTPSGTQGHCALSRSLRMDLLNAAARELRDVRRQLTLPHVMWATLAHRDERAIWQPHWRLHRRQAFHDGVCVAGLLVAVRQTLIQCEPRDYPSREAGATAQPVPCADINFRELRGASRIAAAIAGECDLERWVRTEPHRDVQGPPPTSGLAPASATARDRVRRWPWERCTASWQAAYNTACLYAALASENLTDENRIVVSLERAINNRDSEMERAYDWIWRDPDFSAVRNSPGFAEFLRVQERTDYPLASPADRYPAAGEEPVAGDPLGAHIAPVTS